MKKLLAFTLVAASIAVHAQQSRPSLTVVDIQQLIASTPLSSNIVMDVPLGQNSNSWGGVRQFRYVPTAAPASNNFPAVGGGRWVPADAEATYQDPRWWQADPLGVTDSTPYIQALVDSSPGKTIVFPKGTFKLRQVRITNNVELVGHDTTIHMMETNAPFFIDADFAVVRNFTFDGETEWPYAVSVNTNRMHWRIEDNKILNLNSKTNDIMCVGIYSLSSGGGYIHRNYISNLVSAGNGILGDRYGMVRGIDVEAPSFIGRGGFIPLYVSIRDNYITDLDHNGNEDTDGIVVTGSPFEWHNGSAAGLIAGNTITNVGKRGLKISGSGYTVAFNKVKNNYDGAYIGSTWGPTKGYRRQLEGIGANYGNKILWLGNEYFGGATEYIIGFAPNEVSSSYVRIIGNTAKFNPNILWTNNVMEGISSYGSKATNVIIAENDIDVVNVAVRSDSGDKNWLIANNTFRHVFGTNGAQYPDATGGTGILLGHGITAYNQFEWLSPSNVIILPVKGHHIIGNTFDNFNTMGLVYNATNCPFENNLLINGTGDFGLEPYVVGVDTNAVFTNSVMLYVTNKFGGSYSFSQNAKHGVFGGIGLPTQWHAIESHGPLLLDTASYYDDTYNTWATNFGTMAMFQVPNRPGFRILSETNGLQTIVRTNVYFDASNYVILSTNLLITTNVTAIRTRYEYPELFTYKISSAGWTTNVWKRIAKIDYRTLGTKYGADIAVAPAGGPTATVPIQFRVDLNQGEGQIKVLHTPWADAPQIDTNGVAYGQPPFVQSIRLVVDPTNKVGYVDFLPGSYRAAGVYYYVKVIADPTDVFSYASLGEHGAQWNAVAPVDTTISGAESVLLTVTNLYTKLWSYANSSHLIFNAPSFSGGSYTVLTNREYALHIETNTIVHALSGNLSTFNIRATNLQWNGTNLTLPLAYGTGVTNDNGTVKAAIAAGSNVTLTTNVNTVTISAAGSSLTFTNGTTNSAGIVSGAYLPGANVTFTTNAGAITIASTGGGSGPTNGSAIYVKGTGVTVANFVASGELDPTYSGTNLTYALVIGSVATNKIDSTFYNFINNKQAALTFTNGVTNAAGIVQAALVAGSNVTLSTNLGAITISATGGGGLTNGSAVFVDGVYQSAPNFADSSELNVAVSGTNATYNIIANSIATNKIDSTFYNFINNKQSALSFSTGTTNSGGTVTAALAAGTNMVFTTNANTITINSTAAGGGGGLGTNLFVNNVLSQPAKLTNSATITWTTNSNGDIVANAAPGAATGVFFASSKLVTVASTNLAETSVIGAVRAGETTTLPANSLYNGAVLRITASGLATATGNWDNNTIKVKIGSAILTSHWRDLGAITFTGSPWSVIAYLTMYTNGASAVYGLSGKLEYVALDQVGGAEPPFVNTEIPTISGSLDTTTANTIDITFQNNAGNAFDSFDCRTVIAEFLPMGSGGTSGSGTYVTSLAITNIADSNYITWGVTNNVAYPRLVEPNKFYDYYDDLNWMALPTTGPIFTTANGAGAGASIVASETNAMGIIRLSTGTTATGNNRLQHGATATDSVVFGTNNFSKCETRLRLPVLSNGTDRYTSRACFYDATSGNATDGAYFEYTDNVNSGNWVGKVYSNSSLQSTNLTVGPTAATWQKLEVQVDGYLGYAYFFVDGTLQATITTGIPLGASRGTGVRCIIESTSGANADLMEIDYLHVEQFYTPAR